MDIKTLHETKFLNMFDLQYEPGKHYFMATRRSVNDIVAAKSDEEFDSMNPDAVSCIVILKTPDHEPRLLLSYEYRHAIGRFLLGVPAGLIDEADCVGWTEDLKKELGTDPVRLDIIMRTAMREIKEETGLAVKDSDTVFVVNPLLFSTAGMTDESNALVCAILQLDDLSGLSQKGAEGSEIFDGFELLTKNEAMETLRRGRDRNGNFYLMHTWAALAYFVSGTWEQ